MTLKVKPLNFGFFSKKSKSGKTSLFIPLRHQERSMLESILDIEGTGYKNGTRKTKERNGRNF